MCHSSSCPTMLLLVPCVHPLQQGKQKEHLRSCLHNSYVQPTVQNLAAREAGKCSLYSKCLWPQQEFQDSITDQEEKDSYRGMLNRCCLILQGLLILFTSLGWPRPSSIYCSYIPYDVNHGVSLNTVFKCFLKYILKY